MSKLGDSIIEQLLACTTQEKEEIGTRIVELLSGDATKKVTNLPPRRGNADGGIDGRIKVFTTSIEKIVDESGVSYKRGYKTEMEAAVSVKIEKDKFSPKEFGYFKYAMEREKIFVGIIIAARGLSPDVEMSVSAVNNERIFYFYHISLKDIIMWQVDKF